MLVFGGCDGEGYGGKTRITSDFSFLTVEDEVKVASGRIGAKKEVGLFLGKRIKDRKI